MNFVINDSQLFLLLDSVFPDLSVKKIRSRNSAHTYIMESNDDEMFHYENGTLNVNPDFVKMLNRFAPIKITDDIITNLGKWIYKKTGLKSNTIWIGLKSYDVSNSMNESEKKKIKRFDRSLIKDYGKYGKKIESLSRTYLDDMGKSICDLVCLCSEVNGKENYIVLIISSHYLSSDFETKLTNYITNFIPVDVWVMVNVNHHCNSSD